ncbi:MAG: hypothetical protein NTV79_05830, partial [Candidatus Aureabacteria bacterium]|nr:hypothetical protein [Candidatus Auribacterota bacterium]
MDTIEIPPRGPIDAAIALPGSKSITNRALIIAALAEGTTILSNWLECEDTAVMIRCLLSLGFSISRGLGDPLSPLSPRLGERARVRGGPKGGEERLVITGGGGKVPSPGASLNALNSGTTIRFLAGLVSLGRGRFIL